MSKRHLCIFGFTAEMQILMNLVFDRSIYTIQPPSEDGGNTVFINPELY
jgi:hypothetical protein